MNKSDVVGVASDSQSVIAIQIQAAQRLTI